MLQPNSEELSSSAKVIKIQKKIEEQMQQLQKREEEQIKKYE